MSLKVSFNRSGANAIVRGGKRRNYVSYSTQGLGIDVVAHTNNSSNTLPKTTLSALRTPELAVTIAPGHTGNNVSCTSATAGAFSCTILVPAPAGYDDVQITAWDQAPDNGVEGVGGTFNGTSGVVPNDLSTSFLAQQLVLANQSNSFNFTMDGVVNSVSVTASVSSLVSGADLGQSGTITTSLTAATLANNSSFPVQSVVGLQPGDAVTIGSGASQESLTIATITDGASPSFTTTAGAANAHNSSDAVSYSGPINPAAITLSVNEFDAQGNRIIGSDPLADANGNPLTVTVQPSETAPGFGQIGDTGSGISLFSNSGCAANVCTFTTPQGSAQIGYNGFDLASVQFAPALSCGGTCAAPTGSVQTVPATISFTRMTDGTLNVPGSPAISEVSDGVAPWVPVQAPDGTMWVGDFNTGYVHRVKADGTVIGDIDLTQAPCNAGRAESIAEGSDGRMWVTTGTSLCAVSVDGSNLRNFGDLGIGGLNGLVLDGSGHMWVASGNGYVDEVNVDGTVAQQVILSGEVPQNLVLSPADGKIYVADWNGSITQIDPSTYATNVYPIDTLTYGSPTSVAASLDGSVWAVEFWNGYLAKLDPSNGTITQTKIATAPGSGGESITLGPDGNLYAAYETSAIYKIAPANGAVSVFSNGLTGQTIGVGSGPNNTIWTGEYTSGKIARFSVTQ